MSSGARGRAPAPRSSAYFAVRGFAIAGGGILVVASFLLGVDDGHDRFTPVLGPLGLGLLLLAYAIRAADALWGGRGVANMPTSVGRRRLDPMRGLRMRMVVTMALAVGIPLVLSVAATLLVDGGWTIVVVFLMFSLAGAAIGRVGRTARRENRPDLGHEVGVVLERLCMRADMPVPEVVAERDEVATAFTSAGRLHLTTGLLETLEGHELEAVIAHELAHLAHRDAAVMDIATGPSRLLFGAMAACLHPGRLPNRPDPLERAAIAISGIFFVPVCFGLGWLARLLVLGLSRARELSADAAAATLTGRPSALASALIKLEPSQSRAPRTDLRAVEALCIVEIGAPRWGRLLHTHPPIGRRIERLESMEERLQAGADI